MIYLLNVTKKFKKEKEKCGKQALLVGFIWF